MHELRQLLEEVTAGAPPEAPVAEVHRRIQRLRRRRTTTIGAATVGVVGIAAIAAAAAGVDGGHTLRPTLLASASSPAAASASASSSCTKPPGFPSQQDITEVLHMTWPSGARAASAQFPGSSGCVITIVMAVPEPAPEDVAAARERWGDLVELEGLRDNPSIEIHPTA